MDITFPPELQWVSYLAGGAWPQGSETRMWRINEHFASASADLQNLVPDLNRVRSETLSVLFGDTAMAASDQFDMLFGGDYSVDKLARGASALGDGAQSLGVEIEYSKLSIIVGLALAAVEISWCLANSIETGGASMAWIPSIEWATATSIRRLVATVFERISTKLGQMLQETTIKDLVHHGVRESFQELGQGLAQEGIVQGIQVGQGNSTWRPDLIRQNAFASMVGGGAGGATALPVSHALGAGASKLGRAAKGMTTMFTAGIAGNVAGTAAVGGEFDTLAVIGSSAGSSIGGVKGIGGHASHPTTDARTGLPPRTGEPPSHEPLPDGGPLGDDDVITDPKIDEPSVNGNDNGSSDNQGQAPPRVSGARITDESDNGHINTAAAQSDPSARSSTDSTDQQSATADLAPEADPSSAHAADVADPSTTSPGGRTPLDAHTAEAHTAGDPSGHHETPTSSDVDEAHAPPTHDAPLSAPEPGPESRVEPASDQTGTAPTDPAPAHAPGTAPGPTAAPAAPAAPVASAGVPPTAAPQPAAAHPAAATPTTTHPSTTSPTPTPVHAVQDKVSASPTTSTSPPESTGRPAARLSDTAVPGAKPTPTTGAEPAPVAGVPRDPVASPRLEPDDNCAHRVADALTNRYGRDFRVPAASTSAGVPARALFEGAGSRADFASYADVADRLRQLGPGSSAILSSSWAGDGHRQGGHAYLAVNDGGEIHLIDFRTGERAGWPPHWGQDAVSRTAVGYLDARGEAVHPTDGSRHELAAADAVGDVKGHPESDPGERWRDVTPQHQVADDALAQRGVQSADELRNPLGLMEAASERARDNATWWHGLTGDQQRALIDAYPHQIGNAEGIPAGARHAANAHALDQQRRELQTWRDRGERLTRVQRKELARLDRIQQALDRAGDSATQAGVGGPLLLAFDSGAFSGDGRAVVSFGEDPYKADKVAWHVPGQGMTIDQLGYCMGDALNHLQSTLAEDSSVKAASIAWIGYDTPSGRHSWRAAGHTSAREGAKILYSDVRAFNTVRDTLAGDDSHFSGNHIFAHSYGSTTASYAGRDGRLANDIRTVTLAGSSGAGPLQHASEFGIGEDNVYVASSSRDPFTALGGRTPGSMGRIFGIGLGIDPAMQSFGAQRVTAEFSSAMDHGRNRGTHNAYYRFVDRGTDPPLRSESLANFGRIFAGRTPDIQTDEYRTVHTESGRFFGTRERTVEPAAERPLNLDGDTDQSVDRETRRLWNPRWHAQPTEIEPSAAVGPPDTQPQSIAEALDGALKLRGVHDPDDLVNPVGQIETGTDEARANAARWDGLSPEQRLAEIETNPQHVANAKGIPPEDIALARARANATWWKGLSETQRQLLIDTYPRQIGNSEGIYAVDRNAANRHALQRARQHMLDRLDRGERLNKAQRQFLRRMNRLDGILRKADATALQAGIEKPPLLLAFDPSEFNGDGRALLSFGEDPHTADSVSWHVPGFATSIDRLGNNVPYAIHHLQSTLRAQSGLPESEQRTVASMVWIGYDAPNDSASWRVVGSTLARAGGEILYSDVRAFNAARDLFTADGSHFTGNHIFAHSYGSTTASYAGAGGRLANDIRTVTLLGSPGAGPMHHAGEFEIGVNRVFVASSSRDPVTGLGGRTPEEVGRLGRGLGMDPALDAFGAVRVSAEFPTTMDLGSNFGTHRSYYAYVDSSARPAIRSESLANFGRIAAERYGDLHEAQHRRVEELAGRVRDMRMRTVEPEAGRPLRLDGDTGNRHPVDRRLWNPRWLPGDTVAATVDNSMANDALALRGVQTADELMNPLGSAEAAETRARANATWWKGLSPEQRQALVETHSYQIGNAEGIYATDRNAANRHVLQRYRDRADQVQDKISRGVRPSREELDYLRRVNRLTTTMSKADAAAQRAGLEGPPLLLAFDPPQFGGDGRVLVSFGADPYEAESVSWYVPGMAAQINRLDYVMHTTLNTLQSTRAVNPDLKTAAIAWLGYDAPNDNASFRVARPGLAEAGGEILYSDIRAFNATRDTFTGNDGHFNNNHVFAHSYGSTTASYAGAEGRLADHINTVTLIGSPGAGPLQHARDFGIGADNVFVASSSRDYITGLGGRTSDSQGRAGIGLGPDPAMRSFGAQRIAAEFSASMDRPDTTFTHNAYFDYLETDGRREWLVTPESGIRSESLANFGRIAAGDRSDVRFEQHRTLHEQPRRYRGPRVRTVEPAAGRPFLRIDDDPGVQHSADRHTHRRLSPRWLSGNDCAHLAADELSQMYEQYGLTFQVTVAPTSAGVPARALFEAVGSSAQFQTYDQVQDKLLELGHGSSAVLASRWHGTHFGGHAYLAVNDNDTIYLYDPHTGHRSKWPPYWGEGAVDETAVGYLHRDGSPDAELTPDASRQLVAADAVGDVKGHPQTPSQAAVNDALSQRDPPVSTPKDLVHPLGVTESASSRARDNAAWWAGLSPEQRQLLVEAHPHQIGRADGVFPADRDAANNRVLQGFRDNANQIQAKLDRGEQPNKHELKFLQRLNRIDTALNEAKAAAGRAGLDPPLLLAFDPGEFGGKGRLLLSFGTDPSVAENVTWHVDRRPIDELESSIRPTLHQLQSSRQGTPSAAAIMWIGNEASKIRLPFSASTKMGTDGVLYTDLAAFHTARVQWAATGDGAPLTENRVHSLRSKSAAVAERMAVGSEAAHASALWVPPDAGSLVVAHRGASHEFPEQTLAAYQEALRQGANGLECDIHLTRDGHLVCIHDARVDRTSDGTGRVKDMTLAEMQALDYGGWHPSRELGDGQGDTGLLTLERLVQLVVDHDQPVTLFIEVKQHGGKLERELVALLNRYGIANPASADQARVAVISFYPDALMRVRSAAPTLPTVLLGQASPLAGAVGATAIGPSIQMLRANPELVDLAAAQGRTTYCWTVNDPLDVQFARDLGVGWIATDHPGRTNTLMRPEPASAAAQETPSGESIDVRTEPAAVDATETHHESTHHESILDTRELADDALAQRVPPVRPDELRNSLGSPEEARARARNNATWWEGLSERQREALIETYPRDIGNAEGIPPKDRDAANRNVVQELRDRADEVRSKIDEFGRPSREDRAFLKRIDRLDLALQKAAADAKRAGVDGPLLLAFDPAEFGGDGRAVLSFGDDPYNADSVSWHVPGIRTTMHSFFGFHIGNALHHLQSTLTENPAASAASIAWIGYDTPNGRRSWRAFGHQLARTGGDLLYSDITAFNAARDTLAGDGSHFTGNHVFGHSYGSTATGYAGQNGRLAGHVRTVSLLGSPGAGPVRHASEFGIGAENVFVASSSRDVITTLGGRTPGSDGRILGRGLGIDPAMDSFGAHRIAAESSSGRNRFLTGGPHLAYYLNSDTTTDLRSESLANLGRIAAGRHDQLITDAHRTVDGWHTVEPAANRSEHRIWNPPWRSDRDCAHVVADELSSMYGHDIRIAVAPTRAGVPARSLFEAAGTRAEFATYDDVAQRLTELGDGSTAVLASRWAGGRNGGHAYLAINEGGEIRLYDPHTRQRSGWPPHWGETAVSRTAVGYLGVHGNPTKPLSVDASLQLGAADTVGHVRGLPVDPDFVRRQEEYRAQDPATRHVDSRYAQSLAGVIDNPSQASVNQLAEDLSGIYGPYRIRLDDIDRFANEVLFTGKILHGDTEIGTIQRGFARDAEGNLVAYHNGLVIKDEFTQLRGQGFSKALTAEMERFYVHSGVDRIELQSHDKGTRAWARRGFTWDPDQARLQQSLDRIRDAALQLSPQLGDEARTVLDELVQRLRPDHPRLPELIDIVDLAAPGVADLGERLVDGVKVNFVRYLPSDVTTEATPQAHNGFGARLKRLFGIGGDSRSDQDCAHTVADELSAMYGRDVRVATARSRMGVPAWALFEAVGTRAEFATYDDVAGRLHQLGDGASAVLASRWAGGHRGGHAYLAVNEGGQIHLYDPHTRQRSGWPPHWGQHAVTHTAVGYLDADGEPVHPLNDVPRQLQLDAADIVGDVKGHPNDPDFPRRQEEYRAQDPATREVNARYADPLADVVDNLDQQQVRQLADDLSGIYGPYRVEMWRAEISRAGDVIVAGYIFSGDEGIGFIQRTFVRDADGNLVARHDSVEIDSERFKFKGFSRSLSTQLEPYYESSGVDRIELSTEHDGGYVWARRGFTWNADTEKLEHSLQSVRDAAQRLMNGVSEDAQAVLRDTMQRLEAGHPRLPEPVELASLATPDEPDLGRQLMYGTKWYGVRHLLGEPTALSHSEFDASLTRGLTEHLRGLNCAHLVANEVWDMYGREIRIEESITSSGVPARALFEAVGSNARFATYDEVADELRRLGPGSSAVLASRWAGGRQGGHAYLAINVDGEVFLVESHSGRQLGWPPYWGEGAVARTAVGYLDPDGNPTHPLHDRTLQLAAADEIGHVAGTNEAAEFQRAREEYRAQNPTTRQVDTRYAEPLGDVVDDCWDRARVRQLAEDLSGMYGPYRAEFYPQNSADAVFFDGVIFSGTQEIGTMMRRFARDGEGNLVAHHILVSIDDEHFRGNGFSKALTSEFERYYQRSGFDRIQLATSQNGGYAWARRGFTWNPDPARLEPSLRNIRGSANHLRRTVSAEAGRVLDDIMARLHPERSDLPDPIDLAALATPEEPDLGRRLMDGAQWSAVKYLHGGPAAETSSHNCAEMVAGELSARYDRDVRLGVAPSPSGVPARALFEAIGSASRFATYDDVAQNLRELGDGSAAVLASGWARGGGRYGGHAYLAVNDGGSIHLIDPFTGERTGWPPAWGQHAVYRTAVGYLDANGDPVHPLGVDRPLQLYAADTVGDVRGHQDDGDGARDGARAQRDYRAQDRTTRPVDTRFAEPLPDVLDNAGDRTTVDQLATDLSGRYGPYRVNFRGESDGDVFLAGVIMRGDTAVGTVELDFFRDHAGDLVASIGWIAISDHTLQRKGFTQSLIGELEQYCQRSGVDRLSLATEDNGGVVWARLGFTWDRDPLRLQQSLDSIKASALRLRAEVPDGARAVLDDIVARLDPQRSDLPEPRHLTEIATRDVPDLGRRLMDGTRWFAVKHLHGGVQVLGLPDYAVATLSDVEATTVYTHGEHRMRELEEQLEREGMGVEDRARILFEQRNSLRAWTRDLMSNRATAEVLAANDSTLTFDELVARNEAKGLTGDAVYDAIIHTATHGRFVPGTLSDVETTSVYSDFELRLREFNEQLMRDGMPVDERARLLSDLRSSLRGWTRELMSNRAAADWLAANESNPSFEDLVARYEAKGLTGDAVYEAIVDAATHSHYATGTLSNAETRTVYTTFELRMREVSEQLVRDDVGLEEQARTLYELRASIRTWTRALMADRETADYLTANEPNPTFEDLVARQRAKGRVGDEIYQAIIASATRSRASVNESLGIDPENPPDLPPMRGPTNNV